MRAPGVPIRFFDQVLSAFQREGRTGGPGVSARTVFLVFIGLLSVISLSAQSPAGPSPSRFEKDGIIIDLRPVPVDVEGYRSFELKAMNTTELRRSVHCRISLVTRTGDPAGKCTVYIELNPGEAKTRTKACKETVLSRSFRFEIVRVFPFILDKGTEEKEPQ